MADEESLAPYFWTSTPNSDDTDIKVEWDNLESQKRGRNDEPGQKGNKKKKTRRRKEKRLGKTSYASILEGKIIPPTMKVGATTGRGIEFALKFITLVSLDNTGANVTLSDMATVEATN